MFQTIEEVLMQVHDHNNTIVQACQFEPSLPAGESVRRARIILSPQTELNDRVQYPAGSTFIFQMPGTNFYDIETVDLRPKIPTTEAVYNSTPGDRGLFVANVLQVPAYAFLETVSDSSLRAPVSGSCGFKRSGYPIAASRFYYDDINDRVTSSVPVCPSSNQNTSGSISLGTAALKWSTLFAATGTINTSDEREKQQIQNIDEAVYRAWSKVEFKQFKFNDAVERKGENARIHFGLIAQQVKEAFELEGLDAFKYGLLCYDEWEEFITDPETKETALAGNRYGIRYEEALALECAYQRWELQQLKASLNA
jgi:hypothetical protein